jgi:hypothetical protein
MPPPSSKAGDGGKPGTTARGPAVENRWWVEQADAKEKERRAAARADREAGEPPKNLPGARLFLIGKNFDQEQARARLTDSNLNFLREANPAECEWAYLATAEGRSPEELILRTKRALKLPPGARGVLVDSGTSLRAIVTGTPVGERMIEVTLGPESCLDAWVKGDWVHEQTFASRDRAFKIAPGLIASYLREQDD